MLKQPHESDPEANLFSREDSALILGHEIMNTLAGLSGLAGKLAPDRTPCPRELQLLRSTIHYLEGVAESVMSRQGASVQCTPDVASYSPALVLGMVAEAFSGIAGEAGCLIETDIRLPADLMLQGQGGPINLIIGNLLSNAVKHGAGGRILVSAFLQGNSASLQGTASSNPEASSSVQLVIDVEDSGLSDSVREDGPARRKVSTPRGWGIGLPLVRRCCRHLGGELLMVSEDYTGTVFRVRLPACPAHAVDRQSSPVPVLTPDRWNSLTEWPVLVIEDNFVLQQLISGSLQEMGLRCRIEANGCSGTAAALSRRFAAILVDYQLPGLNGCEVVTALRRDKRLHPSTLIVGMTAHGAGSTLQQWLESGLDGILLKSSNQMDLRRLLDPLLGDPADIRINQRSLMFEMSTRGQWDRLHASWLSLFETFHLAFESALVSNCESSIYSSGHRLLGHLKALLSGRPVSALEDFLEALRTHQQSEMRRLAATYFAHHAHIRRLVTDFRHPSSLS